MRRGFEGSQGDVSRLPTLRYSAIEAQKSSDALKELEGGNEVALLFADVALPGMNDDELARKFRALASAKNSSHLRVLRAVCRGKGV
jgi:CheY-like chemotaxis protein